MLIPRFYFTDDFTQFENILVQKGATKRFFSRGTQIWAATSPNRKAYYVLDGVAKFFAINDNGEEVIFFFMGHGSIYPLICMNDYFTLEPFLRFSAGTDCTMLEFPVELIEEILYQNPDFGISAIDHYCKYTNALLTKLLINSYHDMEQRVYSFLYFYVQNKPEFDSTITLSQEELASTISVSKPQLARILKKLRDRGIIATKRRGITILAPDELKQLCNDMVQYPHI